MQVPANALMAFWLLGGQITLRAAPLLLPMIILPGQGSGSGGGAGVPIGNVVSKPFVVVSSLAGGHADFNGPDQIDAALDSLPVGGALGTPAKGGTVYVVNDGIHAVTAATGIEMPNTNNVTLIGENGCYVQAQAAMTTGIFINTFRSRGHVVESILFDENNFAAYGVYWVLAGTNETSSPSYFLDVEVLAGNGVGGGAVANTCCFQFGAYDAAGTGKGYEDCTWVQCVASGDTLTGLAFNIQIPSGEGTFINPKCFGKPFFTNCVGLYIEGGSVVALAGGLGTSVSTAGNAATGNLSPCLLEVHGCQLGDTGSTQVGTYPPPRQGDAAVALTNLPPVTLGVFDSVNTRLGACEGGVFENNFYVINAQAGATVILFQIGLASTVADRIGNGTCLRVIGGHLRMTAAIAGGSANPAVTLFNTYGSSAGSVVNSGLYIMYQAAFGTGNLTDMVLGAAATTQMVHEHLMLGGSNAVTKWTPLGQNPNTGVAFTAGSANHQNISGRMEHWTFLVNGATVGNTTTTIKRGKTSGSTDFQNDVFVSEFVAAGAVYQYVLHLPPGEWAQLTVAGTGTSLSGQHVVLS